MRRALREQAASVAVAVAAAPAGPVACATARPFDGADPFPHPVGAR